MGTNFFIVERTDVERLSGGAYLLLGEFCRRARYNGNVFSDKIKSQLEVGEFVFSFREMQEWLGKKGVPCSLKRVIRHVKELENHGILTRYTEGTRTHTLGTRGRIQQLHRLIHEKGDTNGYTEETPTGTRPGTQHTKTKTKTKTKKEEDNKGGVGGEKRRTPVHKSPLRKWEDIKQGVFDAAQQKHGFTPKFCEMTWDRLLAYDQDQPFKNRTSAATNWFNNQWTLKEWAAFKDTVPPTRAQWEAAGIVFDDAEELA